MFFNKKETLFLRGFYTELYLRIKTYLYKAGKNKKWFLMS
jgi:hypothetical protein